MGAWGYKALESDEGLDVVDFLRDRIPENLEFDLAGIIDAMKSGGFFGASFDDIDFFYDHSAMALAELYLMFLDTGTLDYENDEEDEGPALSDIKVFRADPDSLLFLLRYLQDIRNEVPDEDDEREIVELWRDSKSWKEWKANLDNLAARIDALANAGKS